MNDADPPDSTPVPPPAVSGPVAALAGLALPGLGYFLGGERARGLIAGCTILLLFIAGLLIGGARVIDVPGYDEAGTHINAPDGWILTNHPITAVMQKPWFVPQALVGPVAFVAAKASLDLAVRKVSPSHARVSEIGVLYTAVAGGLNLLVIIDAASRATARREAAARAAPDAEPEGFPIAPAGTADSRATARREAAVRLSTAAADEGRA